MPSKFFLMLRSARRARLEARTRTLRLTSETATILQTRGRACHEQRIGRFAGGLWLSRPCLLQCRDVPGCREAARGARSEFPGRARPGNSLRAGRAAPGAAVPDHLQDRAVPECGAVADAQ